MKLTEKQIAELWGEDGPYSEARFIIEHRILDDSVSRIFLRVEVNINPFTFKIIKKYRKEFINDEMVQKLLNHSHYLGFKDGYIAIPFEGKFLAEDDGEIIKEARQILEETKQAVIRMHKYVIKIIDKPAFTIRIN
jgi:hypothetical protein